MNFEIEVVDMEGMTIVGLSDFVAGSSGVSEVTGNVAQVMKIVLGRHYMH